MPQTPSRASLPSGRLARLLGALSALVLLAGGALGAAAPAGLLNRAHPKVQAVMAVQDEVTPSLMAGEDVLGTATGLNEAGDVALVVYVNEHGRYVAETVRAMPKAIGGVPVVVELTEPFRALAGKAGGSGGSISHKAKQSLPIQLGTSGGWAGDLANGYCCGGTLGALISVGTAQYVLSNYHVFEADTVSGGNGTIATTGDSVIQPGLIDVGCAATSAQSVGTLIVEKSLPTSSNVDASVAQTSLGTFSGDILEIGTLSSQTVGASIGQAVKKSGRTTGLTRSSVSGLNATVSVTYDNECAGGVAFTKTFTGQIVIKNRGSGFLAGGDSGSLMVEDVTTKPRAVGLLFAGSSTSAIANPIGEVLTFLGGKLGGTATIVGQ